MTTKTLTRTAPARQSGWGALRAAGVWAGFDAVVHVVVDQVEPARIAGNIVVLVALGLGWISGRWWGGARVAGLGCGIAAGGVLGVNAAWVRAEGGLPVPAAVFVGGALCLLLVAVWRFVEAREQIGGADAEVARSAPWLIGIGVAIVGATILAFVFAFTSSAIRQLHDDTLIAADYWDDDLIILSAGLGFDGIIGTPDDDFEATVDALGSWYESPDCVEPSDPLRSVVAADDMSPVIRGFVDTDDGLPIVMSWPVLTSTVHPEDFLFTLNDRSQVVPNAVTMTPNWEHNERNVIVAFGDFGNRGRADESDALFPVKLEIVDDGSPLMFVGPDGARSGVGLTWETDATPYDSGPKLVGAKLNTINDGPEGEGGVGLFQSRTGPNDEFALYGGGDFRIRMLTTGGFSPDGLTGVTPDQFSDFFRLHARDPEGQTVLLTETGVTYDVAGGRLRVVGLSDLGKRAGDGVHFDDCYAEDADNYIDIILEGDEIAARNLTHVEIPAGRDGYLSFYNPGGPGPEPFSGVRYTAPGPRHLEPIIDAIDDPMRVNHDD